MTNIWWYSFIVKWLDDNDNENDDDDDYMMSNANWKGKHLKVSRELVGDDGG